MLHIKYIQLKIGREMERVCRKAFHIDIVASAWKTNGGYLHKSLIFKALSGRKGTRGSPGQGWAYFLLKTT